MQQIFNRHNVLVKTQEPQIGQTVMKVHVHRCSLSQIVYSFTFHALVSRQSAVCTLHTMDSSPPVNYRLNPKWYKVIRIRPPYEQVGRVQVRSMDRAETELETPSDMTRWSANSNASKQWRFRVTH